MKGQLDGFGRHEKHDRADNDEKHKHHRRYVGGEWIAHAFSLAVAGQTYVKNSYDSNVGSICRLSALQWRIIILSFILTFHRGNNLSIKIELKRQDINAKDQQCDHTEIKSDAAIQIAKHFMRFIIMNRCSLQNVLCLQFFPLFIIFVIS